MRILFLFFVLVFIVPIIAQEKSNSNLRTVTSLEVVTVGSELNTNLIYSLNNNVGIYVSVRVMSNKKVNFLPASLVGITFNLEDKTTPMFYALGAGVTKNGLMFFLNGKLENTILHIKSRFDALGDFGGHPTTDQEAINLTNNRYFVSNLSTVYHSMESKYGFGLHYGILNNWELIGARLEVDAFQNSLIHFVVGKEVKQNKFGFLLGAEFIF